SSPHSSLFGGHGWLQESATRTEKRQDRQHGPDESCRHGSPNKRGEHRQRRTPSPHLDRPTFTQSPFPRQATEHPGGKTTGRAETISFLPAWAMRTSGTGWHLAANAEFAKSCHGKSGLGESETGAAFSADRRHVSRRGRVPNLQSATG